MNTATKIILLVIVVLLVVGGYFWYSRSTTQAPAVQENGENFPEHSDAAGIQPNAALVVAESIQGKWQSTGDSKFIREFRSQDVVVDWYDNETVSTGLWVAFLKGIDAPEVSVPLEENTVYIQMTMTGTQADTLNFKVVKATPEELELIYLDRGNSLRFTRLP